MAKKDIQELIGKGRMSKALDELSKMLPSHMQNEVVLLKGHLSGLERDDRMGLLSHSEASRTRSKITLAALNLLSDAEPSAAVSQSHSGSGDNVAGDKIVKQVNINTNNAGNNVEPAIPTKSILFAAANPSDEARLQTDVEHRTIKEEMKQGEHRDKFEFLPAQFAVRITDLLRAFKDKPSIIHFAGHGDQDGILISTDENKAQLLNIETIKRLFKKLHGKTELVILNSCYSAKQAEFISTFGIVVIGYNLPVGDRAALSFSKGFYLGLSEGMSYEDAYNDGVTAVMAENMKYVDVIEVWKDGLKMDW